MAKRRNPAKFPTNLYVVWDYESDDEPFLLHFNSEDEAVKWNTEYPSMLVANYKLNNQRQLALRVVEVP